MAKDGPALGGLAHSLGEELYNVWIGDPAQIAAMRVRKQKTNWQDALLLFGEPTIDDDSNV